MFYLIKHFKELSAKVGLLHGREVIIIYTPNARPCDDCFDPSHYLVIDISKSPIKIIHLCGHCDIGG